MGRMILQLKSFCIGLCALYWMTMVVGAWADGEMENDFQLWAPVTLQVPIREKIRTDIYYEGRLDQNWTHYTLNTVRGTVNWSATPNLDVGGGYQWNAFFRPDEVLHEHRILEYATYSHQAKGLKFQHRLQVEQRLFPSQEALSSRLRLRSAVRIPMGKTRYYGLVSNEAFLNVNDTRQGPDQGLDQTRSIVGLGRKFGKFLTWELGYLLRFSNAPNPQADRLHHAIYSNVTINGQGVISSLSD